MLVFIFYKFGILLFKGKILHNFIIGNGILFLI